MYIHYQMDLLKTEYSENKGIGKLDKVLLKFEESNFYKLIEFLYTSQNEQALILKALYEQKINIILKFGIIESTYITDSINSIDSTYCQFENSNFAVLEKEYKISRELCELPNFVKYFCLIRSNDDIKNIINNKKIIPDYKMCYYGEN